MSGKFQVQDTIVCKVTPWFLWRAIAMLLMFSIFSGLFFMDGMWGYREKNLHFYTHLAFVKAGQDFQEMENDSKLTESGWKDFASQQKVIFPENAVDLLPRNQPTDMAWPEMLVNGFSVMSEQGGQDGAVKIWEDFTASMKKVEGKEWDIDPVDEPKSANKIRNQFIALVVALLFILLVLFFLIRTMRRNISADHEALDTQDGRRIPYTAMRRVDKRNWDTKGIAFIYYEEGREERKAKIDGMVYGQFKEKNGAPAERLFERVMANFKGEIVEYLSDESQEEASSDEAEMKSGGT